MSIAQGTTHYGYPQVQLTDRPTFADFNPAFADIDAKLYGLITGAATDEQAIADLGLAVGGLRIDLGVVSDTATAAKNKADANEEAIGLLGAQVSQNTTKLGTKIDSNAIAEPYDTSATYGVGDVVTYHGQRYRCITAVAVAEPFDATKWTGEDVETVLDRVETVLGDVVEEVSGLEINVPDFNTTPIHTMNNGAGAVSYEPDVNCLVVCDLSVTTGIDSGTGQPSQSANKTDNATVTRNGVVITALSAGENFYAIPYAGRTVTSFLCKAGDTIELSAMLATTSSYVRFYELA